MATFGTLALSRSYGLILSGERQPQVVGCSARALRRFEPSTGDTDLCTRAVVSMLVPCMHAGILSGAFLAWLAPSCALSRPPHWRQHCVTTVAVWGCCHAVAMSLSRTAVGSSVNLVQIVGGLGGFVVVCERVIVGVCECG